MTTFEPINNGFNSVFKVNHLSVGLVVPIENYGHSTVPTMQLHLERVKLIDRLGFKALWLRDVPLHVPTFGDAGQTYDPFTYLGYLAGSTSKIALGTASIALPLHHPLHVAKSAATIDQLSNGRLILGVASGDRPQEYPGMGIDFENRGDNFRAAFEYIRSAQENFPTFSNHFGTLNGQSDILPKPKGTKIPMLLTGYSRQSLEWNAENSDGWMNYPSNFQQQAYTIAEWRDIISKTQKFNKPFMQPLYVVLNKDDNFKPQMIQLGFKIGMNYLIEYLNQIREIGVNHVAINLRFNSRDMETTLNQLAEKLLPHFHKT